MIEVSMCCHAPVEDTWRNNPQDHHDPIPTSTCSKCNQECDLDYVCEDCLGTGIVTEGEYDDIREKKCHCVDTSDMDDDS